MASTKINAEALCREWLVSAPANPAAWSWLAETLLERDGHAAEAEQAALTALRHDPESVRAMKLLGDSLLRQGRLDAASQAYEQALARNDSLPEVLANLGQVRHLQKRNAEALALCGHAVALNPKHARARVALALVLKGVGRVEAGIEEYRQALVIDPELPNAFPGLAAQFGLSASVLPSLVPQVAAAAETRVQESATTPLTTLLAYLLIKLLALPKAKAVALVEQISLSEALSRLPQPEHIGANPSQIFQKGVKDLQAGRGVAALGAFREVAKIFVGLVENGRIADAATLSDLVLGQLASTGRPALTNVATALTGALKALEHGELTEFAHLARLRLYTHTDGMFNDLVAALVSLVNPPIPVTNSEGVLGTGTQERMESTVQALRADGYRVMPGRLPADVVKRLVDFSYSCPGDAIYEDGRPMVSGAAIDMNDPDVIGYNLDHQNVLDSPEVQRLILDPSFWAVAQEYLGCKPVCVGAVMRWSLPSQRPKASDTLAQYYHWDAGWVNWLNFFMYLTDVDQDSGPHMYVRGTHRRGTKPAELRQRFYARIPDQDIERLYPAEDVVTVIAPAGTMFGGDTRCWHKGLQPTKGSRLTLQFSFASTVVMSNQFFGRKLTLKRSHLPEFRDFISRNPGAFPEYYYNME